ncbi:MAG: hypothetical protein HY842_00725 [Bacteroidetes bacterium]|nr:hypothetical protein [Bacteroidota bacterium]
MALLQIFTQLPNLEERLPWETKDTCLQSLASFCAMTDMAHMERDSEVFYDAENVETFFNQTATLFEEMEYFRTPKMRLYEAFSDALDWRTVSTHIPECAYILWDLENGKVEFLYSHTLCEIAERILSNHQNCLLILTTSTEMTRGFFPVFKDAIHIEDLPRFVHIPFAENLDSLEQWLSKNRESRLFNLSPKHGENGQGHWQDASPLLCDRQRAQELLGNAIGDKRLTPELYNFDEQHDCCIVFKYENDTPQNQYHGYHVSIESIAYKSLRELLQKRRDTAE